MPATRFFRGALIAFVIAFAFLNFSENTADVDLWGHVLFGHRLLATGQLPAVDPYSWTAGTTPWINHEILAEVALAGVHRLAGGGGIFWLMLGVGLATFALAIRLGTEGLAPAQRSVAWLLGFLATPQIAFGFAARPQMFTALFLVLLLWSVRRMHAGRWWLAGLLPPLFVLWVNAHGGVIAAVGLLWIVAAATTCERVVRRRAALRELGWLWGAAAAATACLYVNPWGGAFVRWLVGSVAWLRPQIEEWQPAEATLGNAGFFALLALGLLALVFSRRPRPVWEVAVCGALALAALRSVRHTPLFCLAAVAILPPHLADAAARLREATAALRESFLRPAVQAVLAAALALGAGATCWRAVAHGKEHPFTMEVPRALYPLAATAFVRDHGIRGNMLSYFDWGELCLWELPDCRPSIDGRLDTCYARPLIDVHWQFYGGKSVPRALLDLTRADFALLPHLACAQALARTPGWTLVYTDPLATVLVRDVARFPGLAGLVLPVTAGAEAVRGRAPFPDQAPALLR